MFTMLIDDKLIFKKIINKISAYVNTNFRMKKLENIPTFPLLNFQHNRVLKAYMEDVLPNI